MAPIKGVVKEMEYGEYYFYFFNNRDEWRFWPFSNRFFYVSPEHKHYDINGFNEIFNGFDYLEFAVYSLVAVAIIMVPKWWK